MEQEVVHVGVYLTHRRFLQESIPPQIRQLILDYFSYKVQVDGFVWEWTNAKRLENRFV